MTRDPNDLTAEMLARYQEWLPIVTKAGLYVLLTRVACSLAEQAVLHKQGRNGVDVVNLYRKTVGWPPITHQQNTKVTWTLASLHIVDSLHPKSRAFDFAITTPDHSHVIWGVKMDTNACGGPDYAEAGMIWEKCGGVWGGRWKTPDRPHCQ